MSDTEKPSWEWRQEIQETVMLYQDRIDALLRRLAMMTVARDRLEALMDDPQALAAYLVARQKGKP